MAYSAQYSKYPQWKRLFATYFCIDNNLAEDRELVAASYIIIIIMLIILHTTIFLVLSSTARGHNARVYFVSAELNKRWLMFMPRCILIRSYFMPFYISNNSYYCIRDHCISFFGIIVINRVKCSLRQWELRLPRLNSTFDVFVNWNKIRYWTFATLKRLRFIRMCQQPADTNEHIYINQKKEQTMNEVGHSWVQEIS